MCTRTSTLQHLDFSHPDSHRRLPARGSTVVIGRRNGQRRRVVGWCCAARAAIGTDHRSGISPNPEARRIRLVRRAYLRGGPEPFAHGFRPRTKCAAQHRSLWQLSALSRPLRSSRSRCRVRLSLVAASRICRRWPRRPSVTTWRSSPEQSESPSQIEHRSSCKRGSTAASQQKRSGWRAART